MRYCIFCIIMDFGIHTSSRQSTQKIVFESSSTRSQFSEYVRGARNTCTVIADPIQLNNEILFLWFFISIAFVFAFKTCFNYTSIDCRRIENETKKKPARLNGTTDMYGWLRLGLRIPYCETTGRELVIVLSKLNINVLIVPLTLSLDSLASNFS